jgi:hypothetical protein
MKRVKCENMRDSNDGREGAWLSQGRYHLQQAKLANLKKDLGADHTSVDAANPIGSHLLPLVGMMSEAAVMLSKHSGDAP